MYQYHIQHKTNKADIIDFYTIEDVKTYVKKHKEITPDTHDLFKYADFIQI